MRTRLYRVNEPAVVYEVFDGEVVIVNLDNGNYYSLEKVAAELWNGLVGGESESALIEGVQRRYAGAASDVADAIQRFLTELQDEGLISLREDAALPDAAGATADWTGPASDSLTPFEPPIINRFTDMQELLLLDPIHEVDETGWPHVKAPEA
jgi:hypothetical protein